VTSVSTVDETSARLPGPLEEISLAAIRERPLEFLGNLQREHGDLLGYVAGGAPVVLASHPEHVLDVLKRDSAAYTKENTPDLFMLRPLLGEGLLTSTGRRWRRQRATLAPLFRPAEVRRFDAVMVDAAQRLAADWAEGVVLDVEPVLSALTLEILVEAIFGRSVRGVGDGFGSAVGDINHFIGRFGGEDLSRDPLAGASLAAYRRGAAVVHGITDALIQSIEAVDHGGGELLRRLRDVSASRRELHDQVLTLVMAGHETTAKTLVWALHLLSTHPQWQDRVAGEARAALGEHGRLDVASVSELPVTSGVVREAMRLYPPVWLIARRTVRATRLGGVDLRPDTLVCLSPWLVHRDPRWWPDPDRFDPTRSHDRVPAQAYFPFGGGERVCVGQHFALLEAVLVLATVLAGCVVTPAGGPVQPEALVTLRPREGLRLQVGAR
jgi:cytochrome P450